MPPDSPSPIETTPDEPFVEWTPEQLAAFQAWSAGYGEQDENGIDLSLIRSNLKLTPLDRVRLGDHARRIARELRSLSREHRGLVLARMIWWHERQADFDDVAYPAEPAVPPN